MPDFENFIKTIKSGDYERALKKYKFDTDLGALEILKKYFASKTTYTLNFMVLNSVLISAKWGQF